MMKADMFKMVPWCLLLIFASHSAFAAFNTGTNGLLLDDKFKAGDWSSSGPAQVPAAPVSPGISGNEVEDKCFDDKLKKPIACVPDFVNAAYGLPVSASSTCGEPARQFCSLTKDRFRLF
jgi:hypothetical protein